MKRKSLSNTYIEKDGSVVVRPKAYPTYTDKIRDAAQVAIRSLENPGTSLVFQTRGYDIASTALHALANDLRFVDQWGLSDKLHDVAGEASFDKAVPDTAAALAVLREILEVVK